MSIDQVEFDTLHRTYFDDLRRFIYRRLGDRQLAEDIAQETFLRAYRSRRAFDPTRPAWPWLAAIARNLVINARRDAKRRPEFSGGTDDWEEIGRQPDPRTDSSPERSYASHQQQQVISASLAALSPRQQRILMLRCWRGLSYDEIARIEGLTIDALKSLLKRARRSFRLTYAAITGDSGIPVIAGWPLVPLLKNLHSRWIRARNRLSGSASVVGASPALNPLIEAAAVVGMAALVTLSSSPATINPNHAANRKASSPTSTAPDRDIGAMSPPGSSPALPSLNATPVDARVGEDDRTLSVRGGVEDDQSDRRTIGVERRDRRPGSDEEEGSKTTIEIPCALGSSDPLCRAVDQLTAAHAQGTGR